MIPQTCFTGFVHEINLKSVIQIKHFIYQGDSINDVCDIWLRLSSLQLYSQVFVSLAIYFASVWINNNHALYLLIDEPDLCALTGCTHE